MRTQFEPEDLEIFRALIREEIQAMVPKETEPKYYTRKEAAQLLKISLPTLHAWAGKGLIRQSKIGNRVLIEEAEVQKVILKMRE